MRHLALSSIPTPPAASGHSVPPLHLSLQPPKPIWQRPAAPRTARARGAAGGAAQRGVADRARRGRARRPVRPAARAARDARGVRRRRRRARDRGRARRRGRRRQRRSRAAVLGRTRRRRRRRRRLCAQHAGRRSAPVRPGTDAGLQECTQSLYPQSVSARAKQSSEAAGCEHVPGHPVAHSP